MKAWEVAHIDWAGRVSSEIYFLKAETANATLSKVRESSIDPAGWFMREINIVEEDTTKQPHNQWLDSLHKSGCVHNWVYIGHGHNSDSYRCSKCGVEGDY